MKKIGLLSDTHGYWDEKYAKYFGECDEIWHAGDIGSVVLADQFAALKPFRAVYGNIDGQEIRLMYPRHSHILKVQYDPTLCCLHINPGAAGISGFHTKRTLVRFCIDDEKVYDLEVIELGDRY